MLRMVCSGLGLLWGLVPLAVRRLLMKAHFFVEASTRGDGGLKVLLAATDDLEAATGLKVLAKERGIHPKHRVMKYHQFFVDRVRDGDVVVDIGCGYGAVANSVAQARAADVYGIDFDAKRLAQAKATWKQPRLQFVEGDALKVFPAKRADVVILSNVLEHIEKRVDFLQRVIAVLAPRHVLVRVPILERHWAVGYRKELGLPYFSDDTHYAEHTQEGWVAEIESAGLKVVHFEVRWGEIWCECIPAAK